jgi:hypothetical protein
MSVPSNGHFLVQVCNHFCGIYSEAHQFQKQKWVRSQMSVRLNAERAVSRIRDLKSFQNSILGKT